MSRLDQRARRRDGGMTLVEVLISVSMLALLMAVISGAIIVTLRQHKSTTGRLNLSQAEQSVGLWLPTDLASADHYSKHPGASPCGAPACGDIDLSGGSNVLMLTWTIEIATTSGVEVQTTNVSYHFAPSGDGETYILQRVKCVQTGGGGWDCEVHTLLRDLPGPPAGRGPFIPGVLHGDACVQSTPPGTVACTEPDWMIEVSVPLAADATNDDPDNYATGAAVKDANRVIVTIDGGGTGGDSSGGKTKVSITAGGTNRVTIPADSLFGTPDFVEARSRCGGPLTLIVDESYSIHLAGGSAAVLGAVREFAETLVGTPIELQIVRFRSKAAVAGAGSEWSRYFDLTDVDGDVRELLIDRPGGGSNDGGWMATLKIASSASEDGGNIYTNWEDALFRTFYNENGTISDNFPETVVFFTDGYPTRDRQNGVDKTGGDLVGQPEYARPPYEEANSSDYNQVSFNRAAYIATENRTRVERFIGVGVGGINDTFTWVSNPGTGYVLEWERGSGSYYKAVTTYQTNRTNFQIGTGFSSNLDYELRSNGSWGDVSPNTYFSGRPTSSTDHTQPSNGNNNGSYRIRRSNGSYVTRNSSTSMSLASAKRYVNEVRYYNNTNNFRVTSWGSSSAAEYKAATAYERQRMFTFNTTGWTNITQAQYEAGNYTSDESDGFRISTTYTWLTKEQYETGLANPEPNTTYHQVAKRWAPNNSTPPLTEANAPDWEPVASPYGSVSQQKDNENNPNDGYRATRTYPSDAPAGGYVGYTPPVTSTKTGAQILANLVAGDDTGVPYVKSPDGSDNAVLANMYILPPANQGGFSQLRDALKAVALGECGGTLTIRTEHQNAVTGVVQNPRDPFRFQNTRAWTGTSMVEENRIVDLPQEVVTTNQAYPTGTFDYTVPGGTSVLVEVVPQNYGELTAYTPSSWTCRAGITTLTEGSDYEVFPVLDEVGNPTGWTGVRVIVSANHAVSCTLRVVG